MEAYIVSMDKNGKEVVEPTTDTRPGDLMEYRLTFTNRGESAVSGLDIVDSIPLNTTFIGDSAQSDADSRFEVSIDGGRSFEQEPVKRIETQADGTQKQVVVPPEQYTHVRWVVEEVLDANGGTQQYAYRVIVE